MTKEGEYFWGFETEKLPKITWEEMVRERKIFSPGVLIDYLTEAEKYLVTAPGPNLDKRKVLVPEWLGYWRNFLTSQKFLLNSTKREIEKSNKLVEFNEVKSELKKRKITDGGVLFVAGAEGHAGHIFSLEEMAKSCFPIWIFERDSYFTHKSRPGPFLPLTVRLSMWCHTANLGLASVAPECPKEGDLNMHYQELFNQTGARKCYADEKDPFALIKIRRGEYSVENLLAHQDTPSTSDRVKRLMEEGIISTVGDYVNPMSFYYPNFYETKKARIEEVIFNS